jgi:hypothetical protein
MSDDREHEDRAPTYTESPPKRSQPLALLPDQGPGFAVALAKAEIDTQIATARAFPRAIGSVLSDMIAMATMNPAIAEDCIYSLPRGGKQIRGPSIRFAEIARAAWGNSRDGARVTYVDRMERIVECEAMFHDLQNNIATTSTVRRTIELKKGRLTVDPDMVQLAGAAGMSIARRNAVLGGIPRFVWQQALDRVENVIRGEEKTLVERRDRAIAYFAKANIGIDKLLKAVGKPTAEDIDLDDLVTMTGWRTAITQGDSTLDEIFPEDRKAGRKDLGEQLDALANDAPAGLPVSAGAGEEGNPPPEPPSPNPEGAPSRAPEGAAAAQPTGTAAAAPPSDGQIHFPDPAPGPAAGKPASGGQAAPARQAPADAKTAASAGPKPADPVTSKREALAKKGFEVAAKGHDALMDWLDNLPGDAVALCTPAMEKAWKEQSEQSSRE